MRAITTVSSPGCNVFFNAQALVQPHETRTLEMFTALLVLFLTRNGWVNAGPRGTDPKSLDSSSNIPSAQEAAMDVDAVANPRTRTILYRNMVAKFLLLDSQARRVPRHAEMRALSNHCNYFTSGSSCQRADAKLPIFLRTCDKPSRVLWVIGILHESVVIRTWDAGGTTSLGSPR